MGQPSTIQPVQRRRVWRLLPFSLPAMLLIGGIVGLRIGLAQTAAPTGSASPNSGTASICVLAFADLNKNGVRDADEGLLSGADLSLLLPGTSNTPPVLIANHVSDSQGQSCFDNLTPGQYLIAFSDSLAIATNPSPESVTVAADQQITRDFGALPTESVIQDANSDKVTILLTRRNRVIIGLIGAGGTMLFMVALGLLLHNGRHLLLSRPPREPEDIR